MIRLTHSAGSTKLPPFRAISLGRDSAHGLALDGTVSRRHATLVSLVACVVVVDEGSLNGTFVGGRRVRRLGIASPGETVRFGSVECGLSRPQYQLPPRLLPVALAAGLVFLFVAFPTVLAATVPAWLLARSLRLRHLQRLAREAMVTRSASSGGLRLATAVSVDGRWVSEAVAAGALTGAEFMYSWARIDPMVVQAAGASGADGVQNGLQFAQWIDRHFASKDAQAIEGFVNRLVGYAGEQRVAELLAAKGHIVEMAATPNNPAWDLLVDHEQLANVKTVAHFASAKAHAASDGVVYFVPEDAAGHVADGMVKLEGFSYAETKEAVLEAVSAAKGDVAIQSLGYHVPWVTIGFAAYRNYQEFRLGKDYRYALTHTVIDGAVQGAGVVAGAAVGGKIGSLAGGLGTFVGAVAGGFAGSALGRMLADYIKRAPLRKAHEEFLLALDAFGESFAPQAGRMRAMVAGPVQRDAAALATLERVAQERVLNPGFILWPDYFTVATFEAKRLAGERLALSRSHAEAIESILEEGRTTGRYRKLGALMANASELCGAFHYDPSHVDALRKRKEKVRFERIQIDPKWGRNSNAAST